MSLLTQKLLHYSLNDAITLGQLKKADTITLDEKETEKLTQRMEKHHILGITEEMPDYPSKFSQIKNPPYLFYAIGNLSLLQKKILGIVGPREMSPYADQVMEALFQQAQNTEIVTVSGLARGVDQKCHQLSIKYNLPTIALLGGGLRRYLRTSERTLIHDIVEHGGLVLSEFKLDFEPTKRSFPQRNRLIAGLSDVLFLPEAREGSGSLITANFALQMQKEVFVAPNQLFSTNGKGSNQLVSEGKVKLLTHFDQLLEKFTKNLTEKIDNIKPNIPLTSEEGKLLELVRKHNHQDLSTRSGEVGRDFWELLSELTLLEMKGVIAQSNPWCYFVK